MTDYGNVFKILKILIYFLKIAESQFPGNLSINLVINTLSSLPPGLQDTDVHQAPLHGNWNVTSNFAHSPFLELQLIHGSILHF